MKYLLPVVFFIFTPAFVSASVVVSEIMYDLDGADIDWVEVYNPDSADIEVTSLKLLVSNSTSNHGINHYAGSAVLRSGDYGVIVASAVIGNFTSKWGSAGNIFTASFTLPNTDGNIQINTGDKNIPLDSASYNESLGAKGNGKSLTRSGATFIATTPTPGSGIAQGAGENGTSSSTAQTSETTTENATTTPQTDDSLGSSSKYGPAIEQQIFPDAGKDKIAVVGADTYFEGKALGINKKNLENATFFWNFGDGEMKKGRVVLHTYHYPGDYIVNLNVSSGEYSNGDRLLVKSVPA